MLLCFVAGANKCVFCWRHHKNPVGAQLIMIAIQDLTSRARLIVAPLPGQYAGIPSLPKHALFWLFWRCFRNWVEVVHGPSRSVAWKLWQALQVMRQQGENTTGKSLLHYWLLCRCTVSQNLCRSSCPKKQKRIYHSHIFTTCFSSKYCFTAITDAEPWLNVCLTCVLFVYHFSCKSQDCGRRGWAAQEAQIECGVP